MCVCLCVCVCVGAWLCTDSSDKLRQPKIGALMKQVMGGREDMPGTFSRGGECVCVCVSEGSEELVCVSDPNA